MDRRVVSGMVGLMLVGSSAGRAIAQVPSAFDPIPSIDRSINAGVGPASAPPPGVQPPTPDTTGPVSMTPVPPIGRSINAGKDGESVPGLGLSSFFRKARPRTASTAVGRVTPAQAAPPIVQTWTRSQAQPSNANGRPAPFANQIPANARPQSDPTTDSPSTEGRPAPMADDHPGRPRPRAKVEDRPQSARPRPPGEESNTPAIPSTLPSLEAEPRPATAPVPPPPVVTDPMAAITEPVIATPPPVEEAVLATTPPVPEPPVAEAKPEADPQVTQAGAESTAVRLKDSKAKAPLYAGLRAASVGDEIITLHELELLVTDRYHQQVQGQPQPTREEERQLKNMLAADTLDTLINQAVILQEAKRVMAKNPKGQQQFADFIAKKWKEDQLPSMLRQFSASNEFELKKRLGDMGRDYEQMRETYRKSMMAQEFQMMRIHDKITADFSEQKTFYLEHIHEFDQPARFSFREIEVKVEKYKNDRALARKQAEALKLRLSREDFDVVARSSSDGPTASQGGLYADMTPGGYGIPSVNDELNKLGVGQTSGVIEAPYSFHIVRVESRREAGPLRFDEVQPKIREAVLERNFNKLRTEFVANLRAKTLVRSIFENTESDPNQVRRQADPAVRAASNP